MKILSLCFCLSFIYILFFYVFISPEGFISGTQVLTQHGHWSIEKLSKNIKVISYDLKKNKTVAYKLKQITTKTSAYHVQLYFDDHSIRTAPDQLFFIHSLAKWVTAESLITNQQYINSFRQQTNLIHAAYVFEPITTYCLTTQKHHNFFIEDKSILVHNMGFAGGAISAAELVTAGIGGFATSTLFSLTPKAASLLNPIYGLLLFATGSTLVFLYDKYQQKKQRKRKQKNAKSKCNSHCAAPCCNSNIENNSQPPRGRCTPEELAWRRKHADRLAAELGYVLTSERSHNEKTFYNRETKSYITIDNTCHKGGFWKKLNRKKERIGTFSQNLKIKIGD